MPPARITLAPGFVDGTVPGVLHVHTNRSDGLSSPDDVAVAAARAGLTFIVFTDHGDGTRIPDPPTYRSGVLCVDGVEISTAGGHYIAIGMGVSPYPLGGEPRDTVEDVRRLGGVGLVAHPDSPKDELRWNGWDLPVDALEVLNLDTSWRLHLEQPGWAAKGRLLQALMTYPFRAEESMANLLSPHHPSMGRYRLLSATRRVVGLAGSDAHARLELLDGEPGRGGRALPFPGYESVFRAVTVRVRPDRALTGSAEEDAQSVMNALRAGHAYIAVDGLASPPSFRFTAVRGQTATEAGDEVPEGGPLTFTVRSNAPQTFTARIWRNDRLLAAGNRGPRLSVVASEPGAYIAEIRATDRPNEPPWIISNPIYVRRSLRPAPALAFEARETRPLEDAGAWHPEAELSSDAAIDPWPSSGDHGIVFTYTLGDGAPVHQFAAAALETPDGLAPYDRLRFSVRGNRPMRLSVQARAPVEPGREDHWQRSVFLDTAEREQLVPFAEMTPVGETTTPSPRTAQVRSLVFVVELTHAKPGAEGRVWIRKVALQR